MDLIDRVEKLENNKSNKRYISICSVRTEQGFRPKNEDRQAIHLNDWSFFATYDGHAGKRAVERLVDKENGLIPYINTKLATMASFLKKQQNSNSNVILLTLLNKLFEDSFLEYDRYFLPKCKSGSTAIVAILSPSRDIIWFCNVGDSRAILIQHNCHISDSSDSSDVIAFETIDDKPQNASERKRIIVAGGFVSDFSPTDIPRLNGYLATSRAFGDYRPHIHFKVRPKNSSIKFDANASLTAKPTVTSFMLNPDHNYTIVLASDGLWDTLSSEDVAQILQDYRNNDANANADAGDILIQKALKRGSKDNISVMIIDI